MTNLASLPLRGLILPRADGTFDPLGEIEPNAIEVDFLHVTDDGELIDSIAWHRDRPDIWWTHRDLVPVVGSYEISSSWWDHRPVADAIIKALRSKPEGMSRTEIRDLFDRHQTSGRITAALAALQDKGWAAMELKQTGGRPIEWWRAVAL
jgi:hypothetical protein